MGISFIKKKIEITRDTDTFETREGDNINGGFDMDSLAGQIELELPYQFTVSQKEIDESTTSGIVSFRLKKFDFLKLYYADLDSDREPTDDEWIVIFDGYVDNVKLVKTKTSIKYNVLGFGTLALSNSRTISRNVEAQPINNMPNTLLQRCNLQSGAENEVSPDQQNNIITSDNVFVELSNSGMGQITAKSVGAKNAKEAILEFKTRYGLIFHQLMDGRVLVTSPFEIINRNSVAAWEFDTEDNVFELDYGDLTSNIDGVIVFGREGAIGKAIDLTAVRNKNVPTDSSGRYKGNFLRIERRDLYGEHDLDKVAREILLEQTRNYSITFKTTFDPNFIIGQAFTINDHDIYSGEELFFIKSFNYIISKGDVSCNITGYTHQLTTLPENIVIGATGLADVDAFGIRDKIEAGNWTGFN